MNNNRPSFLSSIPIIVRNLLIINLLLWLASISLPRIIGFDLNEILGLHYFASNKFNPIQLLTYMFMHANFEHLFFNMFALFIFGRTLEEFWGEKKFLIFYIIAGVGAGITQEIAWYIDLRPIIQEINNVASSGNLSQGIYIGDTLVHSVQELFAWKTAFLDRFITVGASGSVFGLLLAFGMIFPNVQIFMLFLPIPIKAKYFVMLYGLFELFGGVRSVSGVNDGIAHFAHLGGMLFGYFVILYWKKVRG